MSQIATHVIDAENRLLEQYKDQPNIKALIDALIQPVQEIENSLTDLNSNRGVASAVGVQLDRLGDIVGIKRLGLLDDAYRTRIRIKIVQNLSEGEPERLIQVYGALLNSNLVLLQEHYPAGIGISGAGNIPTGQETFIYQNIQNIAAAGVRVDYIETFPVINPFACAGGPTISGGFGDLNNLNVGGGMGTIRVPIGIKFVCSGGVLGNDGFGDLRDPVMGGHLVAT